MPALRVQVKAGALSGDPAFAGSLDFGTDEAETIKTILLDVAQELAAKRKADKIAKREADKRAEEEKARLAQRLEDTVSDLYLETIGLCKLPDLSSEPFAAFDSVVTRPEGSEMQEQPASWAEELKAASDSAGLLKLLTRVAWTKAEGGAVMNAATTMLLTELVAEADKGAEAGLGRTAN